MRVGSRWLAGPALAFIAVMVGGPMVVIVWYSLRTRGAGGVGVGEGLTTDAYERLAVAENFAGEIGFDPTYLQVMWSSILLAAVTMLIALVIGFPTAVWISNRPPHLQPLLILAVTIPFWTSMLVRTYAWIVILRETGPLASALDAIGVDAPQMLNTRGATLIGMAYTFLPFMILPIYAAAERFDHRTAEAGLDLGATPGVVLRRIVWPIRAAWRHRRLPAGVHPRHRCLLAARAARRRSLADDRQLDPTAVRGVKKLAVRIGAGDPPSGRRRNGPCHGAPRSTRRSGRAVVTARLDTRRYPGVGSAARLTYLFLYAPLAVVVVYSFNSGPIVSRWKGFSLVWYREVLERADVRDAVWNSLRVAVVASAAGTVLAMLAALGIVAMLRRGSSMAVGFLSTPLLIPEIVTAVGTLSFFVLLDLERGMTTLMLAHTAFCIPFALLPIRARLAELDPTVFEAASDLGASGVRLFRRVTLPLLVPGIVSGALLAFIISLDDYLISAFVAGPTSTTLPIFLFGLIRRGASPLINAVSTLLLLVTIAVLTASYITSKWRRNK